MIKRQIQALTAGACIGVIVQESLWAGLDLLDPTTSLNRLLVEAPPTGEPMAPLSLSFFGPLFAAWLLGGFLGGLMATLVGRHRLSGHAAGVLLSASAATVAFLAWPRAGALIAVAGMPSVGAAIGAGLGVALLRGADRGVAVPSVVTLRAGF